MGETGVIFYPTVQETPVFEPFCRILLRDNGL
jgi:hypothetical protein